MFFQSLKKIQKFVSARVLLDRYEKEFINFNINKWKGNKVSPRKKLNVPVILVELFPLYTAIYFWSYLSNLLSKKYNAEIKFYYFNFLLSRGAKFQLFIRKLKKIYASFNADKGLVEYDFKYSHQDLKRFEKQFQKIKDKKQLLKFKINKINIGDLIYDTYLRITLEPTLKLKDKRFKKIFFRSIKIFEEIIIFFKKNNVKCVIPSHLCYSFGIISRIAISKKIPVIKFHSKNEGLSAIKLIKVSKWNLNESPYYNFKKIFANFSKNQKIEGLKIGKIISRSRVSGNYDKHLPYIKRSQFHKKKMISNILSKSNHNKEKIIIFPHCFYDYPHRFRTMIFSDFYEQVNHIMNISSKMNKYEWYYKPHPHSLPGHIDIHKILLKKFPNIIFLNKNVSHREILELKPKCIITNHGSVAHEYALFNIPSINTGDNPHINYNFSLHPKSKTEFDRIMKNLDIYLRKTKIEKTQIYEFLYMQYSYSENLNNEKHLLDDSFFVTKNDKLNQTSELLDYIIKKNKNSDKYIREYVTNFIDKNLN